MKKKTIFFIALAVFAIIVLALFAPLQKSKYVHIVSEIGISQGAVENNTEMERIKVHGTFWNDGNLVAKNLTATVIFTDVAHNEIVRKNVPAGGDLLANKGNVMEFDSEYLRERTVPKTVVNVMVKFDWMENGQLKTTETLSSGESDTPDKGNNNTGKFIHGNATVEKLDIYGLKAGIYTVNVNGANGTFELIADNIIK